MTTPEEKRINKFLKMFFKTEKQFKEVPTINNCDAMLVFNKNDLKSYHIVVITETKKYTDFPTEDDSYKVVFLKNTNPHDSRKTTHGHVRQVTQKSLIRNYRQ